MGWDGGREECRLGREAWEGEWTSGEGHGTERRDAGTNEPIATH